MTPEAVRAQLARIVESPGFVAAGRLAPFLTFVVERTLSGEPIKEGIVGVEVFGRQASYDPRLDPIVRVEARRLRARLAEYYAGPGALDPVVIEIPKGTYAPVFAGRAVGEAETPEALPPIAALPATPTDPGRPPAPVSGPTASRRWLPWTIAALLIAAAVATVIAEAAPAVTMAAGTPMSSAIRAPALAWRSGRCTKCREAFSIARTTSGGISDPPRIVTVPMPLTTVFTPSVS